MMGNSIVQGSACLSGDIYNCTPVKNLGEQISFRKRLYDRLTAAGHSIKLVGSQNTGGDLMTETAHAGFGGIRGSQLADILETGTSSHSSGTVAPGPYLNTFPADVIILHIGTNDVLATNVNDMTNLTRIFNAIDAYEISSGNPVKVFVAKIISFAGFPCGTHPDVTTYNANVTALVNARNAAGDDLVLIDMECSSGIDYTNGFIDQVHPNQTSFDLMADTWYGPVESYISTLTSEYTLTMQAPSGNGSVSPSAGTHDYADGTNVSLSATPDAGWTFGGWSGDITSSSNPASITMDADKTVQATFNPITYQLSVATDGTSGSSVSPSGSTSVNHGDATSISATAPAGYSFVNWTVTSGSNVVIAAPAQANTTVTLTNGNGAVQANFSLNTYTLNVSTDGTAGASTSPSGGLQVNHGVATSVSATVPAGYNFDGWTASPATGVSFGNSASSSTTVTLTAGNASIQANYSQITRTLTMQAPGGSGTVSPEEGNHSYTDGAVVSLSATPATGWNFANWSGDISSSLNPADITMNSDKTVKANFSIKQYNLTVATDGTAGASTTPTGTSPVDHAAATSISASAPTGYSFVNWTSTGSGVSIDSPNQAATTVSLTNGDATVTANFSLTTYNLTVTNDGTPGASTSPAGTLTVNHGAATSIAANIPAGYDFAGWTVTSGTNVSFANASSATTTVGLTGGAATIRANYSIKTYSLTVGTDGTPAATTSPSGSNTVNHGASTSITASVPSGYRFSGWTVTSGTGVSFGNSALASTTVSLTSGAAAIQANYLPVYQLTVSSGTGGSASKNPDQSYYDAGSAVTLTATPDAGYDFDSWSGDESGSTNPLTVSMTANKAVTANFDLKNYDLTTSTDGSAGAAVVPSGTVSVSHGEDTPIEATPPANYHFTGWTVASGTGVSFANSNNAATTVELISGDAGIQANFEIDSYTLTVTDDGTTGASTSPAGDTEVDHGVAQAISATVPAGYVFNGWTVTSGSGVAFGNQNNASTTVTLTSGAATIRANFVPDIYSLTVSTDGTAGSSTSPSGSTNVSHGVPSAISATVPTGYNFDGWTIESGSGVSFGNSANTLTTVTLTSGDASVQANYSLKTYSLKMVTDGTPGSSTSPSGTVTVSHGVSTSISATIPTGYTFAGWSVSLGSGAVFADENSASTTVTLTGGNVTVEAAFALKSYSLTVTNDGTSGASTNPNGSVSVDHGVARSILATAPGGYDFDGWTVTSGDGVNFGNASSAGTTATLTNGDATIEAGFALKTYSLQVSDDGTTGASTNPAGTVSVQHGIARAITATVPTGYNFSGWTVASGSGVSFGNASAASTTVTLSDGGASIVANYAIKTYTLNVDDDGTPGSSTSPGGSTPVDHGAATAIQATVPTGYSFDGWTIESGTGVSFANASQATTTVTLTDGNASIMANFSLNSYNLTVSDDGTVGATINPDGTVPVDHGVARSIVATAPAGYNFDTWTRVSGSGVSFGNASNASTTVTLTDGDAEIRADFEIKTYTLRVRDDGTTGASTSPSGNSIVDHGEATAITATVPEGYNFSGWTVESGTGANFDDESSATTTVSLTSGSATIQANFTKKSYVLIVSDDGTTGAVTSPSGIVIVSHGEDTNINSNEPAGYNFNGWTVTSGVGVSFGDQSAASTTVSLTQGPATIQANYLLRTYTLNVSDDGTAGASTIPAGDQEVDHGVAEAVEAVEPEGYSFTGWTVDYGSGVAFDDPLAAATNVTLTGGDAGIQANFVLNTYTLTAITDGTPDAGVSPSIPVVVNHGQGRSILASPPEGYNFDYWTTISGTGVSFTDSTSALTRATLTDGNAVIEANFKIKTYTVTATAGENGAITPEGDSEVEHGSDIVYTFTPDEGYEVEDVLVDGVSIGAADNYTFTEVTEPHTIEVSFTLKTYIISPSTGLNGNINPATDTLAVHGSDVVFSFTPDEGYEVEDVLVDGISQGPSEDYTFIDVTEPHTIEVSFVIQTFAITPDAGANGRIIPSAETLVEWSEDQKFSIVADEGYEVASLTVDGLEVETDTVYTFVDVREEHTIAANFSIKEYTITSSAGSNGTISPDGATEVEHFSDQTYTITPDEGYEVLKVVVDGDSIGFMEEYTFEDIDASHTISAEFILKTYIITSSAGANGNIDPLGDTEVDHGTDLEFAITPDAGYEISDVIVDGVSAGISESYSFLNITDDHSIEAEFIKFIEISDVSIPDTSMKIGDVVTANIYVTTDAGNPYTLISGSIGGYALTNLQRIDSVHYTASFAITEGGASYTATQSIPVSNLVLSDTEVQNPPYNAGIVQANDPIDAKRPIISFVWAEGGDRIVGQTVRLIITADGSGYTLDPTSLINGIPVTEGNISFIDIGSRNYYLEYIVEEGDNDVGPSELQARIILVKPSGNKNVAYTTIDNINNLTIDANSPVVSRMTVPAGEFGIGDVVQVTITADGTGYTAGSGTVINEIPLSSPRVSFMEMGEGTYILSYTVAAGDNGVETGKLELSLSIFDQAGNDGGPFTRIEPNSLSVYTELPVATIGGSQTICQGETASLTVILSGRAPFSISLSNGQSTVDYNDIYTSPYIVEVEPLLTTTYTITQVSDAKGIVNAGAGAGLVSVNPLTNVEITNSKTTFSRESAPVALQANIVGGTFTGPGVNSSTGIFSPAIADTVNSPHMIYYSYENAYGCISMDSTLFFVLGAQGDIFVPDDFYCSYEEAFTVRGSNIAEATGSFRLLDSQSAEVAGITDNEDNTASINPADLTDGRYTIEYTYFDEVNLTIREEFSVESVEEPEILAPSSVEFCQNEGLINLESSVAGAVFEGQGISGNVNDGFVFDPSKTDPGVLEISLTNTSLNGCISSISKELTVNQLPELFFEPDRFCVSSRDTVFFSNITADKYLVEDWVWDFDDPESGESNISSEEAPFHIYGEAGTRTIKLTGITTKGCTDSIQRVIDFGDNPTGSFTWDTECYVEGQAVELSSEMESSNTITDYTWTITDTAGVEDVVSGNQSVNYTFDEMNRYKVHLMAETEIGCVGMAEKEIVLKPVIDLSHEVSYDEDFSEGDGWWSAYADDNSDYLSWDYKVVNFENMGDSLSRGWYTDLPDEAAFEQSYINSPCFSFSNLDKPLLSLNISRSLDANTEAAYLEYTTDGGQSWNLVGKSEQGINWYNSDEIDVGEGLQHGWTGNEPFRADEGWINARHDLNFLAGEDEVQFRMVFRSGHSSETEEREGFAFDNFKIANRSRKILFEHFTNTASFDTRQVDGVINNIYNTYFDDMVKLEYHTSFPGEDPFNTHNPSVPAIRGLYYGVSSVPYSVASGGFAAPYRFDYSAVIPEREVLEDIYLKDAVFAIEVSAEVSGDQLNTDIEVTSLSDLNAEERIIYIVVYEKRVNGIYTQNGATNFLNVVKDILPNSAGVAIFGDWFEGQTRAYQYSWELSNVYNPEMLRVAAFIQNDNSKEVYQVEANDYINLTTDTDDKLQKTHKIDVFPNPANNYFYLEVETETRDDYVYELFDQTGRLVLSDVLYSHESIRKIDMERYTKGVYYLRIQENGFILKTEKIILID